LILFVAGLSDRSGDGTFRAFVCGGHGLEPCDNLPSLLGLGSGGSIGGYGGRALGLVGAFCIRGRCLCSGHDCLSWCELTCSMPS
jgi:hypothetical protein